MNHLSFEVLRQSKCFAPSVLLVCLWSVLFHSETLSRGCLSCKPLVPTLNVAILNKDVSKWVGEAVVSARGDEG